MEKQQIKEIFKRLEGRIESLSPYQVDFLKGIKKYYARNNKLSEKQIDALVNIYNGVMVEK